MHPWLAVLGTESGMVCSALVTELGHLWQRIMMCKIALVPEGCSQRTATGEVFE